MFIFVCPSLLFADSIERSISKSLELWNIKRVTHLGSRLKIVSSEKRITDANYRALISGICTGYITQPNSLLGITEIQILNKWEKQGYVGEGGGEECLKHNNLPIKNTKIYVLSRTHLL